MEEQVHAFERAGLGKAPFRVVGVEVRYGPIPILDKNGHPTGGSVGAPGQPMGTCQFCSQGIAECWIIRSSDGKTFDVGCECVRKTGDAGLRKSMAPHKRKMDHAKADARIERAKESMMDADVIHALESQPAPRGSRAPNALSWVRWMMQNAGRAGMIRAARLVESAACREVSR